MIEAFPDHNDILTFAAQLSKEAGLVVKEARQKNELDIGYKDHIELVTSADIMADELICSSLKALPCYPMSPSTPFASPSASRRSDSSSLMVDLRASSVSNSGSPC